MSDVRVLVVDDYEPFRRAVGHLLGPESGFAVVASADSGEQALTCMAHTAVDLVVMDVHLPGISGIDATRRLTADPEAPVVVLVSTYDADGFDPRECGASGYVPKSEFGPDRLADVWSATGRAEK